jgi:addiction module HigA family antidote
MTVERDDIQAALQHEGAERVAHPIHPGELLRREFMEPLGISQSRLASDLGVPFRRVHEIVKGTRAITAETAILLATYFGMSPQFWMNLQTGFELDGALDRMGPQIRRVRPLAGIEHSA